MGFSLFRYSMEISFFPAFFLVTSSIVSASLSVLCLSSNTRRWQNGHLVLNWFIFFYSETYSMLSYRFFFYFIQFLQHRPWTRFAGSLWICVSALVCIHHYSRNSSILRWMSAKREWMAYECLPSIHSSGCWIHFTDNHCILNTLRFVFRVFVCMWAPIHWNFSCSMQDHSIELQRKKNEKKSLK